MSLLEVTYSVTLIIFSTQYKDKQLGLGLGL
jgi:hypothetical protein